MDENNVALIQAGWLTTPRFIPELLLICAVSPFGKIGDAVFILISGYFLSVKGKDVDLIKISKKLIFQLLFATIALTVFSMVLQKILTQEVINPIRFDIINSSFWFVGYYFLIVVIGVLFLNSFFDKLSKNQMMAMVVVLFVLSQLSFVGDIVDGLANGLRVFITGLFLYSLGGYIRRYNPFERIRNISFILIIIVSYLFVFLSFYNSVHFDINNYYKWGSSIFIQKIPYYVDSDLLPLLIGISLFELFRRVNMPNMAFINFLGASTFMVYLIHDNAFVYSIWNTQDWMSLIVSSPLGFVAKYIIWAASTFLIGVIMYVFYVFVCKLAKKMSRIFVRK